MHVGVLFAHRAVRVNGSTVSKVGESLGYNPTHQIRACPQIAAAGNSF